MHEISHVEGTPAGLKIETKIWVTLFDLAWTIEVDYEEDYDSKKDNDYKVSECEDEKEWEPKPTS